MVTHATNMSLSSKREYLIRIHGRYQRAGRPFKSRILDEFCLNCGYHRKAALRLLLARKQSGASNKRLHSKQTARSQPNCSVTKKRGETLHVPGQCSKENKFHERRYSQPAARHGPVNQHNSNPPAASAFRLNGEDYYVDWQLAQDPPGVTTLARVTMAS